MVARHLRGQVLDTTAGAIIIWQRMPATRTHTRDASGGPSSERSWRPITRFASREPLSHAELIAAPVHWPRPSRLDAPLAPAAKKMAAGLLALGLRSVGELLEHLPSDSREARTVAALRAGEQATIVLIFRIQDA